VLGCSAGSRGAGKERGRVSVCFVFVHPIPPPPHPPHTQEREGLTYNALRIESEVLGKIQGRFAPRLLHYSAGGEQLPSTLAQSKGGGSDGGEEGGGKKRASSPFRRRAPPVGAVYRYRYS
jgi:hypothetical protein